MNSKETILSTLSFYRSVLKRPFVSRRKLKTYFVLAGKKASGFDVRLSELKEAGFIEIKPGKISLAA